MPFPRPITLRRTSSGRIDPHSDLDLIATEFQDRARHRPQTPPPNRWFTRKNRRNQIFPVDDNIFGADVVPMAFVKPYTNQSISEKYPSVNNINLEGVPVTDIVSDLHIPMVDVVGEDGSDCCIPGRYSQQKCRRVCPDRLHTTAINDPLLKPNLGGRKRKKTAKKSNKRTQRRLKKRHYSRR
jgi:hypothetical protein